MNRQKLLLLALIGWLTAGSLHAEELDTLRVRDIDEVTVVATPKETRRWRQQPASVTLLSQQAMQAAHVGGLKDISATAPGIFIPDYGSRLTSAIYIRGIGSRINTPSVGLYVDNVPYIHQAAFDFSFADVERIDILRGPQSTLYGRNAMGGLLKVHTKSPFDYQGTDIRLGAATRGSYQGSLTHYHRVSDRFAFSAGGFYANEQGIFCNRALNGRRIDHSQNGGGRLRGIWRMTDDWKADLNVSYEYSDEGGYPYQFLGKADGTPVSGDLSAYIGQIGYNRESGYRRSMFNTALTLEHQARNFIFSAVTGYQGLSDRMMLDQDFTPQDIYTLQQKQQLHTFSEELVLKSLPQRRWQWTTGLFGFLQNLHTQAPVTFRRDGMTMLNRMLGGVIPSKIEVQMGEKMGMNILPSLNLTSEEMLISGHFSTPQANAALFHQSTLNDLFAIRGLSLTAGLRLDYEKMSLRYHSGTTLGYQVGIQGQMVAGGHALPAMTLMPTTDLAVTSLYEGRLSKDYLQLLPRAALQYDLPQGRGNIYASVSKGYRSGGYNIQMFSELLQTSLRNDMMRQTRDAILDATPQNVRPLMEPYLPQGGVNPDAAQSVEYKPEQAWNYEVGTHLNLFDRQLTLDASLFLMETKNQQISGFVDSGLGRITTNAGRSRSLGGEATLTAALTSALTLNAAYGYTYATFRHYLTGNGEDAQDYRGNYVPFVPKHTLSAGAQYTVQMPRASWCDRLVLSAHYRAAGRIYWTEENLASQAFYGTLDGRLALHKGRGQIALWVRNALNRDYTAFYFESMGNAFRQASRPVQAGVEVRCCF